MSDVVSQMRVQTYLTLLSTLSLTASLSQPTNRLVPRVRAAWDALSEAERRRVLKVIHTSPVPESVGKAHLRLVEGVE